MNIPISKKVASTCLVLLTSLSVSHAVSGVWTGLGGDTPWSDPNNWSTLQVPGTGDTATFNGAGNGITTVDVGTGVTIGNITFDTANAAAYMIISSASGPLSLNDGGTVMMTPTVASNQTFDAEIFLGTATGASYTFTNASAAGILTLAGNVQGGIGGTAQSKTLTLAGNMLVSGAIANGGSSALGLQQAGVGTTATLTATNSFTGPITGITGTLTIGGAGLLGGSTATYAGTIANNGTFIYGSSAIETNTGLMSGTGSLVVNGPGTLAIGASPSTYSGPTTINGGILLVNSSAGGPGFANTSPLTINPGGELDLNAGDALGYSLSSPITNSGIIKKIDNQSETMFRPIYLNNGSMVTILTNVEQFESFGNYIATFPNTTNYMTGPGLYGLRTSTCYISNAANSTFIIALSIDQNVNATLSPLNVLGTGTLILSGTNTFGGNIIVSNGTLAIAGSGSLGRGSYAGNITNYATFSYSSSTNQILSGNVSNTGSINLSSPADVVFAGIISGSGTVNQSGSGTVALFGKNTFTGLTTVSAGKLLVYSSQPNTSPVTVDDGGTLVVAANGGGSFSPSTLNLGSANGATIELAVSSTTQAPLTPAILNLTGATNTISVSGSLVAGTSYPLLTYGAVQGTGTLNLTPVLPNGVTGTVALNGNTYTLTVTAVTSTLWKSAFNGTWDINTTANWTAPNGGATYLDGSPVQFDDADNTGGIYAVTNALPITLSPSTVTVANSAGNYSFSTNIIIAGPGGLTKTGTGTLTNSGLDLYTGPTVISQGTLQAGAAVAGGSPLGVNSAVSLANVAGTTLNLNGFSQQVGSLAGGGATGGNVTLGSGSLTVGGDNSSQTYAGSISGTGGLTQIGLGTLTLSGPNSFSGTLNQAGLGTLMLTGTNTITGSVGSILGTLTIGGSGRLNATYGGTVANNGTFNYNSSASETNSALISGAGSLNVNGPGELSFSTSPNLMSGQITVNGGILQFLSSSGGNGCFEDAPITINPGGELDINVNDGLGYSLSVPLTNYGIIKKINSQSETLNRPLYLSGGSLVTTISGTEQFETFGGFIQCLAGANSVTGPGKFGLRTPSCYLGVATNSTLTFSVVVDQNSTGAPLYIKGPGTVILQAVNTFTAAITNGGTLIITNAGSLGSGAYSPNISSPGTFIYGSTASQTLSGVISGGGGILEVTGSGALTLSGVETYTGPTIVAGGKLLLTGSSSINNTPSITISNLATFDVSGLSSTFTLGGSQTLLANGTVNGAVTTASGSRIFPGTDGTVGSITFKSGLTLASGATVNFDVGTLSPADGGTNDQITVSSGALTLNGNAFHIKAPSTSSVLDTTDYVLISAPGGIVSNFNAAPVFDVAPANAAHYSIVTSNNQVLLHYSSILSPSLTGAATPSNNVVCNQSVLISATVTQGTGSVTNVSLNLTPFGGSANFPLVQSGVANVYTNTITVPPSTLPGGVTLVATATDTTPLSASANITFTVVTSTETWDGLGTSGNWDNNPNWVSGLAPGYVGDSLIFAGSTGLFPVMDQNYTVNGLTFSNTSGAFTIASVGTTLTFVSGTGLTNNSVSLQTLEPAVVLGGPVTLNPAAGNITLGGAISEAIVGTGALTLAGNGTATLLGVNTYTGGTTIVTNGTLVIGGGGELGNGTYGASIVDNGTLNYDSSANQTITSIISGTGALAVNGSGGLTLENYNTFSSGTTVNDGTLTLTVGGGTGAVRNTLTINEAGTVTATATDAIGYTTGVCVTNLTINGGTFNANSGGNESYITQWYFTGGTVTSTGGAINFNTGYGITTYASSTEVNFDAPLELRGSPIGITNAQGTVPGGVDMIITGAITGSGDGISQYGTGTLALSGVSTFTGPIVNSGTLVLTGAGQLNSGTFTSTITDNGAFIDSSTASQTVSGIISGTGSLQVNGNGVGSTLTLTAAETYSGATTVVSNGYLTLGAAASINNSPSIYVGGGSIFDVSAISGYSLYGSQILSGSGSVNGAVGTTPDTKIYPGTDGTYGTLTFNTGLTMSSGATLNFDLGTLSPADGGTNDQIDVNNSLTLNGNSIHIKAPSTSVNLDTSSYLLLSVSGPPISGSFSSTPVWDVKPLNAINYTIQAVGNNVYLNYSPFTAPGGTASANPSVNVLRNETIKLTVTVTNQSSAIQSVTVDATPLGGSVIYLVEVGNTSVYTNNLTIPASTGPGPESLTATITDSNDLIGTANITFNVVTSTEKWDGDGPDANFDDNTNWVSGAAPGYVGDNLLFAGSTQLAPFMDQNYTVGGLGFSNTAGPFVIGTSGNTLTLTIGVTNNSANVQTLNVPVVLSGSVTLAAGATGLALEQPVTGTGALSTSGPGTTTLMAVNTYSGSTTINSGTLAIGPSGQLNNTLNNNTYAGNIIDSGTFNYDSADSELLTGIISGVGSLTLDGTGELTLTNFNTFSGGTIVNNGILVLAVGGGAGTVMDTLTINSNGYVYMPVRDGIGYSVGECVTNLVINGAGIPNAGDLDIVNNCGYITTVNMTGGAISCNEGTGALFTFLDAYHLNTYASSFGAVVSAGLDIRGTNLTINTALGTVPGGADLTVSGIINNSNDIVSATTGGIIKIGPGEAVFAGDNTYPGVTTFAGGTLQAGVGELPGVYGPFGTNQAVGAIVFAGGTLQYSANNIFDYSSRFSTAAGQPISIDTAGNYIGFATPLTSSGGSLTLTNSSGAGILTLTAAETYSGNTIINGGTLALGSGSSLANSSSISIAAGATLDVTGLPSYTLGTSASLTASGTAASPSTLNCTSGEAVSFGSSPIILNFDGTDPALTIAQGALSLSGNAFTVNGSLLPSGSYVVVTQTVGNITSSGTHTVNGTAVGGSQASITVNAGQVILTIVAEPILNLSVAGTTLNFSWSALGSTLQSNSISLAHTNDWFNVAGSTSVTNVSVSINKASPAVFFRLLAP